MAKKRKKTKKSKKKKVLSEHKQQGKKFIPPLMQLPGMRETNYIDQGLPQLVWIGLLTAHYGYHRGIELATELAKIAFKHRGTERHVNFALASAYNVLNEDSKLSVVVEAQEAGLLEPIRVAIAPVVTLYEGFPLAFLGLPLEARERNTLVAEIRSVVGDLYDKYKTPALAVLACVIYIKAVNGSLRFTTDVRFPDLDALIDDPDSEAAQHAAGVVRCGATSEFGMTVEGTSTEWPRSFWNQGLKIDGCELLDNGDNGDG